MTKRFTYIVLGATFVEDDEAFGQAWEKAKAYATEKHTYIEREITVFGKNDDVISQKQQIYVGGCFLKNTTQVEPKIF